MTAVAAVGGAAQATGTESYKSSNNETEVTQLRQQVQTLQLSASVSNASSDTGFDTAPAAATPPASFDVASVYAANRG